MAEQRCGHCTEPVGHQDRYCDQHGAWVATLRGDRVEVDVGAAAGVSHRSRRTTTMKRRSRCATSAPTATARPLRLVEYASAPDTAWPTHSACSPAVEQVQHIGQRLQATTTGLGREGSRCQRKTSMRPHCAGRVADDLVVWPGTRVFNQVRMNGNSP